ncbi:MULTISPECIES: NfeD family protein [Sphingomonadales]|uniref:NfeD family protein n=2 Tax=Edaphosphingomonas TaxID=3423724 RepID=A0A2T4I6R2_9SPHN|nr:MULTISPECIES: NfeD family protein [Sphingomonas]AGH48311.1 putative modifier of protease activity [Sphingomonas sp. MM-1]MDX3883496.1 NfeD family protein [Sphingomonas sp.]OHT20783.1 Inner membrane protein YbbJ [Sphingomonas haloaromaticamans]PTD26336.1 NfeD family protein [Sphingomonas fennica]
MPFDLDPHWLWLIAAIVLAIAEIVLPGFFLIWLAAAAAITGAIAFFFALSVPLQALVFAIAALAAVYAGRRYMKVYPAESPDPMLNDRTARLIGEIVTVVEPIGEGHGRVRVGDGVWNASGPEAPSGTTVRVVGAQGNTLIVGPL